MSVIPNRDEVHARLAVGAGTLTAAEVGVLIGSKATSENELRRAAMVAARRGVIPPPVCDMKTQKSGWVWSIALVNRWLEGGWKPVVDELAERRAS